MSARSFSLGRTPFSEISVALTMTMTRIGLTPFGCAGPEPRFTYASDDGPPDRHVPRSRRDPSRRAKGLEGAQVGARGALRVDRLDAHVRGACIAMVAEAAREVLLVAPGDKRVDQSIAPAVREVVVPEAEAPHALLVVREPQVKGAGLTRHASRLRRCTLQENFLLDAEPRLGPQGLARPRGVLGRYQVRV